MTSEFKMPTREHPLWEDFNRAVDQLIPNKDGVMLSLYWEFFLEGSKAEVKRLTDIKESGGEAPEIKSNSLRNVRRALDALRDQQEKTWDLLRRIGEHVTGEKTRGHSKLVVIDEATTPPSPPRVNIEPFLPVPPGRGVSCEPGKADELKGKYIRVWFSEVAYRDGVVTVDDGLRVELALPDSLVPFVMRKPFRYGVLDAPK